MSTSFICRPILALALTPISLSGLTAAHAQTGEQIVLPFECNVVGGRVQVRPSGDQAYRIYGARRQDQYRACSEQNPDRCRTFLVHSFTMACGRDRAAWPDVYAAIAKVTDGRAFYNNDGRLYYRMGPREPRDSYPFPEPRRATGIVEMPEGFAPMAGVDAIFTPLDPRVAELEEGPPSDLPDDARGYRDPPPSARADSPSFAPALTAKPVEKPKAAEPKIVEAPKPAEAPKSQVVLEPNSIETASTSKPDAQQPKAEAKAPEAPASPAPAASTGPVTPTILNNPAAKEVEAASKTETVVAAAEIAAAPSATPAPAETGSGPHVESWSANGASRLAIPPIAFAILIAAATLATLLVILKRQSEAPVAVGPLRVPVEPVLPGLDRAIADPPGTELMLRDDPGPPALSGIAASTGMPVTRDAALAFLGLSAGASEGVIRKVVEGLRQSWHPDLATGDADRAAREERIKVINAAAGLLLRKPAA